MTPYETQSQLIIRMLAFALASSGLDTDYIAVDTKDEDSGIEICAKSAPTAGTLYAITIHFINPLFPQPLFTLLSWHQDNGSWPNHPPESWEKKELETGSPVHAITHLIGTLTTERTYNRLYEAFSKDPAILEAAWI